MSDAGPTYRGYRRQILYTLCRLLEPISEGQVFHLEGVEDLDVYDGNDQLIEVVQVKDLSVPLSLSHIASKNRPKGSFVHRAANLLSLDSIPRFSLISFGPIGPELVKAAADEGRERRLVARKLVERYGISTGFAETLIGAMHPLVVDENDLLQRVFGFLRNSMVGVDPENAFDSLSQWLYRCAEYKRHLTRRKVLDRIHGIGRSVSRRGAHHDVWSTSVEWLEDLPQDEIDSETLANEFYRGLSARYDHVLADLDAPRPSKIAQIAAGFAERNAVIIHAASGQGKTTLAFRALRDIFPNSRRFWVCVIDGREKGQKIATALEGYALEEPIVVFIDVSPNDTGWPELVERIARHPRIQVLVAVREEDWRRVVFKDTDAFRDVELSLGRAEAELIFRSLAQIQASVAVLNFEDAWTQFGGDGPLLEFVYLVTQGELLRELLRKQIFRLKREANQGLRGHAELELLRLVSVAAAYGGRLSVRAVSQHLKLPALDAAIDLLENEYLVRRVESGALLDGLHPIRSGILADLLTNKDTDLWAEAAAVALQLLDQRDISSFLLHSFSRRQGELEQLLDTLASWHPSGWAGTAGVLRALMWLGLREYAEANRELIDDARKDSGPGWSVVLDTIIVDSVPGLTKSLSETIGSLASEERRHQIETLRARQTSKDQIFRRAEKWLSHRQIAPDIPSSFEDWASIAEVSYWLRHLGIGWPLEEWLPTEHVVDALRELPLDLAADLTVALVGDNASTPPDWFKTVQTTLLERFQRETTTPVIDNIPERIKAHFVVGHDEWSTESSDRAVMPYLDSRNPLHNEALVRISLMRRLFPHRQAYASQGYGHRTGSLALPNDDTRKNGIPREKLPLRWATSTNATFVGLVEYETRPDDWAEYANRVLGLREEVARCLNDLHKALPDFLRSPKSTALLKKSIPSHEWFRRWRILRDPPRLPRCAVDEWGFVTESLAETASDPVQVQARTGLGNIPTVRRYRSVLEPLRAYANAWHNFLLQSPNVMTANVGLKKDRDKSRPRVITASSDQLPNEADRRVSTYNLAEAWKALPSLQREHRRLLGAFVDARRLQSLEQRETDYFAIVWPLWHAYALEPKRVLRDPLKECAERLAAVNRRLDKALRRELASLTVAGVKIQVASSGASWDDEPVLWLTVDGSEGVVVYDTLLSTLEAVRRAIEGTDDTLLRHYALDFRWRHVVAIPLINGQSLAGTAWRVNTDMLVRADSVEQLGYWHFLWQPIPSSALSGLGLAVWDDSRLLPGLNLAESIGRLWRLIAHLQDLANVPEVEGVGEEVALRHIGMMFEKLSSALQETLDAAASLGTAISLVIESGTNGNGQLELASEAIQALVAAALPAQDLQGQVTISIRLEELAPWLDQVQAALRYGQVAQLAWASFVLST